MLIQDDLKIKLIDFGFSVVSPAEDKLSIFCGTPSYMAPEIVKRTPYNGMKTDIWALGVLLFKMFTGCFPFRATTEKELYQKIKNGVVSYPNSMSKQLKNLLSRIFVLIPEERIGAEEILKHSWFSFDQSKVSTVTLCMNDGKTETFEMEAV